MDSHEQNIVSIHLESPTAVDRLFRRVHKDCPVYVVEFKHPEYCDPYGGVDQKRHQRRYKDFARALRRFTYLIGKHPMEAAYILDVPVDLAYYRKRAEQAHAQCNHCGSHDFKFDDKE